MADDTAKGKGDRPSWAWCMTGRRCPTAPTHWFLERACSPIHFRLLVRGESVDATFIDRLVTDSCEPEVGLRREVTPRKPREMGGSSGDWRSLGGMGKQR